MIGDKIKNGMDLSWHIMQSNKESQALGRLCDIVVEESKFNGRLKRQINLLIKEIDEEEVIRY